MVLKGPELTMARRQIEALVRADAFDLVIVRRVKVPTHGNSWVWGEKQTLPPQRAAMAPFKRRFSEFLVNTELGDLPDLPYVIFGRHDLNIMRGDTFAHQGQDFRVETEDIGEPEVKTSFLVDYLAGKDTNG